MKAVVFHAHGPLENMRFEDFPDPAPAPEEILIGVRAVSLNGFDPMILRGIPGLKTPLPMIPGADFAGDIVSLGSAVDRSQWKPGDRVTAMPYIPQVGMMGETLRGGAAELVAVHQSQVIRVPDRVSHVEAAALPTAYGTALRMMVTRGQVQKGEKVLILGATGGVGTCCVQLARMLGAEVVACAGSPAKADKLKEIGADHVIDTSRQNFVDETIRLYGKPKHWGGGGVDVIVNYSGGDSWAQSFRALKRHGRLLICGATAGYDPKTDLRYIWSFEFNIIGSNGWEMPDQVALLDMVAERRIRPIIHSERPLSEIRISMQELMDRKVFGKAVLIP
ncbi:MAG: zinc-binding dehydrogenase [Proteobacteria bacterium]|nr:zinc-binding dehydrogenase [Pseudomonadota bacterium]